jgi:hypothetical protein
MLCRLILLATTTLVCAGRVHAGATSLGIARNSLTNQLGVAAHVDRRRPCDDGGLGIRTKCCDESQIGCRMTKRGVTWIELSPIFGEPVRANGVRVGPRETTFFGTLQLDQNEIIIGTSTSYVIDEFATIAPDPSLTPRIPASKRFFNPYCFDVLNDLTPVPIEIPKFDTSVPIKSEPWSPPQVPSSKSSYDPFRFDQR